MRLSSCVCLCKQTQEERLKTYKAFKEGSKRILVATDLVGRGIDIERVNIVINYDMPETDDVSACFLFLFIYLPELLCIVLGICDMPETDYVSAFPSVLSACLPA